MVTSSVILHLKDIRLSIGKREILKVLSIRVNKGDAVTIMGPNGSGKTTLLKVALEERITAPTRSARNKCFMDALR